MDGGFSYLPDGQAYSVSVKPSCEEKKSIRHRYMLTALAMLAEIFVYQCVSRASVVVIGLVSGSPLLDAAGTGRNIIDSNDITSVLFSCGFPIAAEVIMIILSLRFLGLDLKGQFTRDGVTLKDISGGFAVTALAQTAAAFILVILAVIFFKPEDITNATPQLNARSSMLANVLLYTYACLLGPVLEEIIYRGIILRSMMQYNERFAIVFSSLIFGLMHCNFPQAINAFIVGIVFGTLYVRSGSLIPSAVLHILMNTITSISAVMINSTPDILEKLTAGDMSVLYGLPAAGLVMNGIIRLVSIPVGIVVLVLASKNGFGLRRANPAGKSRAFPLAFTTPAWIAVIVIYFVICCFNL